MLRGIRGALAALLLSFVLLAAVIVTRPASSVDTSVPPTSTNVPVLPTATEQASLTPAPTVPFQALDTATLHEAVIGGECFTKLNPLLAGYNHADRDAASLIFDGLMKTDQRGAIVPDLAATQPTASSDGLTYVIRLRTDVKWHDGVPFTSDDVLFTIRLMQDDGFPGPADLHNFWRTVEVDVLDQNAVRFKLAQPLATFTDYLRVGILPAHALQGTSAAALRTHPFNLSPIGTGPYQFSGLVGDGTQRTGLRLRFAATYAERPEGQAGFAIRQIVFHCLPTFNDAVAAFQRGDVQTINLVAPEYLADVAALPLDTLPAYRPSLGAVIYNWRSETTVFFRDLRMRQALIKSLNRPELVKQILPDRAILADSPILPSSWAYASGVQCLGYQPDEARASLALVQQLPRPTATPAQDATPDPNAPPPAPITVEQVEFQLLTSNDPALADLASAIVAAWNAVGIRAALTVVDKVTFRERLAAGGFDAALVELNLEPLSDPDPYSLWRQEPSAGGLNFGGLNERRLSELMENARREPNGIARAELYRQFQALFCERAAAIPLFFPAYFYGVDRRLTGVQIGFVSDPSDRFRTIRDWRYSEQ